ncbi:MAG: hypothetical protein E6Y08_13190 [Paenibacillus sp.]|nr:hypothetical protein [Paenibacillus sp.]MDU4696764.1 hypothetical protein [Paenibacillus sp.]
MKQKAKDAANILGSAHDITPIGVGFILGAARSEIDRFPGDWAVYFFFK